MDAAQGGGILVVSQGTKDSAATIEFCVIENNEAEFGGGIYVEGTLSIQNNTQWEYC